MYDVKPADISGIKTREELATNSKNKNTKDLYRGINLFKRSYQPRSNLVKDNIGYLLVDSHNI
jgi:hypothetical protein